MLLIYLDIWRKIVNKLEVAKMHECQKIKQKKFRVCKNQPNIIRDCSNYMEETDASEHHFSP